jgi:agmatinase
MNNLDDKHVDLPPGSVVVLGVPLDQNSSFRRGPESAPLRIIEKFYSYSSNRFTEYGVDLKAVKTWRDIGNLSLPEDEEAIAEIERITSKLLDRELRVLALGGDHSITYPLVRAYAKPYSRLSILHFDAHPDLYNDLKGNRYSHASPFARIMEEGMVKRLVQVGIRTMTAHQRRQAERFGVDVIEMKDGHQGTELGLEGDVYISLDLDCLDPAFAPGVSHHEPGGFTTRDTLRIIQGMTCNIVGADIVELNPDRDWMGMTAMVAAKLLKEILGKMLAEEEK